MRTLCRFLQFLALGAWLGAILYFSIIVTQGAFGILTLDQAGALVRFTLRGLHWMGLMAALVFLIAAVAQEMSPKALIKPASIGVILMFLLTAVSQRVVIQRMDVLRMQMGSVENTAPEDPRRVAFDRLHGYSVDLEAGVLLIGLASLFLAAREVAKEDSSS